MIGKVHNIHPQPVDPAHTRYFSAGAITIGVEYRDVDAAGFLETYRDEPDSLRQVEQKVSQGDFSDEGVSLHVVDAADGHEYLRFDCFATDPHYHYIHKTAPGEENVNNVVAFDTTACGDMVAWAIERIRTRLPEMLTEAGGGHLVDTLDPERIAVTADQVLALAEEAVRHERAARQQLSGTPSPRSST
jgi:hypothetical protein